MHKARLKTNLRLQRVLAFLRERGKAGATGREIIRNCEVVALTAAISELRQNGIVIDCKREKQLAGGTVYRYRVLEKGQQQLW